MLPLSSFGVMFLRKSILHNLKTNSLTLDQVVKTLKTLACFMYEHRDLVKQEIKQAFLKVDQYEILEKQTHVREQNDMR